MSYKAQHFSFAVHNLKCYINAHPIKIYFELKSYYIMVNNKKDINVNQYYGISEKLLTVSGCCTFVSVFDSMFPMIDL